MYNELQLPRTLIFTKKYLRGNLLNIFMNSILSVSLKFGRYYCLMGKLRIRVFTFQSNINEQHSYIVGTTQGGLTSSIGTLTIDLDTCTFEQIRPRFELYDDRGMTRRSIVFQEFLQIASTTLNPHEWPIESLQTYWFAYFSSEDQKIPHLIPVQEESQLLCDFIDMKTTKKSGDLIIVPQSQVGPVCGQCCNGCSECPPTEH